MVTNSNCRFVIEMNRTPTIKLKNTDALMIFAASVIILWTNVVIEGRYKQASPQHLLFDLIMKFDAFNQRQFQINYSILANQFVHFRIHNVEMLFERFAEETEDEKQQRNDHGNHNENRCANIIEKTHNSKAVD